ncbi:MAG: hypothetical protein DMG32_11545 [Acidobacteria bacterium]|nr:MAG: hypothetical protein DMG32_11545 [Acidobacteriota bacterium]
MKESPRIGLLLAVVALVYVNTLRNEFTMDDGIYILRNPQVTHASVRALFAPHEVSNVFRPVTFAERSWASGWHTFRRRDFACWRRWHGTGCGSGNEPWRWRL